MKYDADYSMQYNAEMTNEQKIDKVIGKYNSNKPEDLNYQSEDKMRIYEEYGMLDDHAKECNTIIEEK